MPVNDDDITITPSLQARIEKARAEYKSGEFTRLKTHEEIDKYFDNLWAMS